MARVLTVNAGSSSLKLAVVSGTGADPAAGTASRSAELGSPTDPATVAGLRDFLGAVGPVDASAHRVVHGGAAFEGPTVVDAAVRRRLDGLADLAPLHNPPALAAIDSVAAAVGQGVPAVACFDTGFHAALPPAAATYALPASWRERWGLRRYGFHGLNHQWTAGRTAALLGRPIAELRTVSCHLGSGSSLAAVAGGRSVDTTMGFTPVEGLVMATRPGNVDPGLVTWLVDRAGLTAQELGDALEHRSGLLALAGTRDMAEVIRRRAAGDAAAGLAWDVHDHRLRGSIAAMASSMGGLDALAFTAGIGEHAPAVREAACAGLAWLGVSLDRAANEAARGDAVVSSPGSPVAVVVVTAREDLMLAAGARSLLGL
jgi:acetate kinase